MANSVALANSKYETEEEYDVNINLTTERFASFKNAHISMYDMKRIFSQFKSTLHLSITFRITFISKNKKKIFTFIHSLLFRIIQIVLTILHLKRYTLSDVLNSGNLTMENSSEKIPGTFPIPEMYR